MDDGSTDHSANVISPFLCDPRFRYVFQKNAGVSAARNRGLDFSLGEWIAFVDPDDYLRPNYFSKLPDHIRERRISSLVVVLAMEPMRLYIFLMEIIYLMVIYVEIRNIY